MWLRKCLVIAATVLFTTSGFPQQQPEVTAISQVVQRLHAAYSARDPHAIWALWSEKSPQRHKVKSCGSCYRIRKCGRPRCGIRSSPMLATRAASWPVNYAERRLEIADREAPAARAQDRRVAWIVERSFAWLGRNRRFSKDKYRVQTSETMLNIAATRLMLNRLAPDETFPSTRSTSISGSEQEFVRRAD